MDELSTTSRSPELMSHYRSCPKYGQTPQGPLYLKSRSVILEDVGYLGCFLLQV